MGSYLISDVAHRTGFTSSALRFYERAGLVQPGRTSAGYRCYDDSDLTTLSFIGRVKGFGLSLDEISDLLGLLGEQRCAPVQDRLKDLVDTKIIDAERRIAELVEFTIELRRFAAGMERNTPDGPCDDTCGCTTDAAEGSVTFTPGARAETIGAARS